MIARILRSFGCAAALAFLAASCGGATPPARGPSGPTDEPRERSGPVPEVSAEIGALNEDDVTRTFSGCLDGLQKCLDAGAKRVEFLGGSVAFQVKVDQSGQLSDARIDQSTLGDHETEECMLGVLRAKSWPKPVGGKTGIASKSFDFDPPNDVRPPVDWSGDQVSETISSLSSAIDDCKKGANGSFSATVYVDKSGKALSVGIAPPDQAGEAAVECLVGVLHGAKYPSPGSWPAKVTFNL